MGNKQLVTESLLPFAMQASMQQQWKSFWAMTGLSPDCLQSGRFDLYVLPNIWCWFATLLAGTPLRIFTYHNGLQV